MAAADNVNPLARQLAERNPGAVYLPASYGRGQMGADFDITPARHGRPRRASQCRSRACRSFEPESSERIARLAEKQGRWVTMLSFLDEGGIEPSLAKGSQSRDAGGRRSPVGALEGRRTRAAWNAEAPIRLGPFGTPALDLFKSAGRQGGTAVFSEPVECLGGEAAAQARGLATRGGTSIVTYLYNRLAMEHGVDLAGTNPTPDNMAGGLTSIEESRSARWERPVHARSWSSRLWRNTAGARCLDDGRARGSGRDITALAAGGAQYICFVTGSGNPSGHPIAPTIKISANPSTVDRMPTHLDVGLAGLVRSQMNMSEAREKIAETVKSVINGAATAAEKLDYLETNISRFGPSV